MVDNGFSVIATENLTSFFVITPLEETRKAKNILRSHGCKILPKYSDEIMECGNGDMKFMVAVVGIKK